MLAPRSLRPQTEADAHIGRVEARLRQIATDERHLDAPVQSFITGGKRLRARLLFACTVAALSARRRERLLDTAVAIELFHAASLLHDDIADRSARRRNKPTLVRTAGAYRAASTGAYLAHLALDLVAAHPAAIRTRFAAAVRAVSHGQVSESLRAFDVTITPDDRMTIMDEKTAAVFALACWSGAQVSGATPRVTAAAQRCGRAFGTLFQIADDVDDLYGSERELGRAAGTDLRQGVISLPIAIALGNDRSGDVATLIESVSDSSFARALRECRRLVRAHGGLDGARNAARKYAAVAQGAVSATADALSGSEWLVDLIQRTVERLEVRR